MTEEKITYILDTNILLHEPFAFLSFQEHDVVVPMTVLEELDSIKDRHKDVSRDARVAIRALEDALADATPEEVMAGVSLPNHNDDNVTGRLAIFNDYMLEQTAGKLSFNENDNRIINTAIHIQNINKDRKVVLVTKDINMRLKAKGAGMGKVEDYRTDQLVDDIKYLSKGFMTFEGDFWEQVSNVESRQEGRDVIHRIPKSVLPDAYINEFIVDENGTFAGIVEGIDSDFIEILDLGVERLMSRQAWGIRPKNIGQAMALHTLLDPHIDLVVMTGPAGSGKTGITASFFSIFVQTYLQTLFLLNKLSIYNRLRSNLSNMSLSVT